MNLQPPAVLNMGAPGSGKTDCLATLLKAGLKLFVICTEPDGIASLLDSCERRGIPIDNLHWITRLPVSVGWKGLKEMAKQVGQLGYEDIANLKTGIGKEYTRQAMMDLLTGFETFVDERTGYSFGDITQLGPDCAVALDSLSGINTTVKMATSGYKPNPHRGEWGVSMTTIENLLHQLTSDRKAFFILNAHIERESNEITGASQIMASTLGSRLAPKIPRFFSEVIYSKRSVVDDKPIFTWSTADPQASLKNRTLPLATTLIQDYAPVVEGYRKRKAIAATPPAAKQPEVQPSPSAAPMSPKAA